MISLIYNFMNKIWNFGTTNSVYVSDEDKEIFLSEQLLQLEIDNENKYPFEFGEPDIPVDAKCFQKTGLITYCGENYVLIDGNIYYDTSNCSISLNVNDTILYLGYKDPNQYIVIVRVLDNNGFHWDNEFEEEIQSFDIIEHILVGQVNNRKDRFVFITDSDLKFNLDDVEGTFIPIQGDWLEMKCSVQQNDEVFEISTNQVLKVISFKALRMKIKSVTVTEWYGSYGTCDRQIYFNSDALLDGVQPQIGWKGMIEAIESTQGVCTWRALKVILDKNNISNNDSVNIKTNDDDNFKIENEKQIEITCPLKFESVNMNQSKNIKLDIHNKSRQAYILNKWIVLSKKRDSQINVQPYLNSPVKIDPGAKFSFTIVCCPKFFGHAKETLVLLFKGFQIKRFVEINVENDCKIGFKLDNCGKKFNYSKKMENIHNTIKDDSNIVPGVKVMKSPHFITVKLGNYPIPNKLWSIVLGDTKQEIDNHDYNKILTRMEENVPCLTQNLNISNYIDKWHSLLYMEEIQENINIRVYDRSNVFLIKHQDYLGIEIEGLAEKRPSLVKGDRAFVKEVWNVNAPKYEGFIHMIKGNLLLMKFNRQFHESYSGCDVSIEFHFSRTVYRRAHHSINLAISNLGPSILFPSRLMVKQQQIPELQIQNVKWINNNLNTDQKEAISNILRGECRPMPYVIFGPPGTGKTVTVIETIIQILSLMPDSRILVSTPSNSASNLLTERLLQFKESFSGSVVRIIANYLIDSDSIPESIKPFCATIDISAENTSKSRHTIKDNINLSSQKSFIGRHRVIIGTCNSLGAMKHWDLPRGHFTHVIVDEAGQATEPEIMIPLTFTDKDYGQIILAGDPMQLGPVVISKYCQEYGMDESFLCRILSTFPYQKDKDAFDKGFDNRLVTKLNENYRSLTEVLKLPSEMFYDGSLIPKFEKDIHEIIRLKKPTYDIFQLDEINDGGGIFVYGIKGCNTRAEDSPSWYNPQEASMVALTTCKLYKNNITVDEIGIITPYVAQTKYMRLIFDSMGLPQPKIGTVEEFQGQERSIILISTVRSAEIHVQNDIRHTLGFLKNPKRLNVAITRAQISVILFCNPHLLAVDPMWRRVIAYAIAEDKYMGCELPSVLVNHVENSHQND